MKEMKVYFNVMMTIVMMMGLPRAEATTFSFTSSSSCTTSDCNIQCGINTYDITDLAVSNGVQIVHSAYMMNWPTDKYKYTFTIPICGTSPGTLQCEYDLSTVPSHLYCDYDALAVYQAALSVWYAYGLGAYIPTSWVKGELTIDGGDPAMSLRFSTTPAPGPDCTRATDVHLFCDASASFAQPSVYMAARRVSDTACTYDLYVGSVELCELLGKTNSPTYYPTASPTPYPTLLPSPVPTTCPTFYPSTVPTSYPSSKSKCTKKAKSKPKPGPITQDPSRPTDGSPPKPKPGPEEEWDCVEDVEDSQADNPIQLEESTSTAQQHKTHAFAVAGSVVALVASLLMAVMLAMKFYSRESAVAFQPLPETSERAYKTAPTELEPF